MPTSAKNVKKYVEKGGDIMQPKKGTPVHIKAAINYNNFLLINKLTNKYQTIGNGEKIKWVYLKDNPLQIKQIAFKGYDDPPKIMKFETICYKGHEDPKETLDFIKQYINTDKIYTQGLSKKITMLYEALSWEEPNDNFGFNKFF